MSKMFSGYKPLRNFIERNYYTNPAFALGTVAFVQEEFRQWVILWDYWYRGYVEDFHSYNVYNGSDYIQKKKKCLKMPKKICEDKADLLLNEKVKITLTDKNAQTFVDGVLFNEINKFRSKSNELIEKTNALGTGAFVQFIDRGKIMIDYLTVDKIIPITIENGNVVSAAFASATRHENTETVYMNVHLRVYPLEPGASEEERERRLEYGIADNYDGYIVFNNLLEFKNNAYTERQLPETMEEYFLTNSTIPRFQIIKPAKANHVSYEENGLGVSVYSNALEEAESIDTVYNAYYSEFDNGISRIFIHDELAQINISQEAGETVMKPMFDKRDTTFYAADLGDDNEKIKHIQPELRVDAFEQGLDRMLNLFGFKCGMGTNYYKFESGVVKTATEVVSNNQPLQRSVSKDQHILREAITNMVRSILVIGNEVGGKFDSMQEITIEFDDSIFEDTDKVRKDALLELNSGAIDLVEYHMRVYKLTEDQAMEKVKKIEARKPKEENIDFMTSE